MKKIKWISLLMVILLTVMCLSACGGSGQQGTGSASSAAGYSSSAGIDMSGGGGSKSSSKSTSSSKSSSKASSTAAGAVKFKDDAARSTWDTLYEDRYIFYWSDSNTDMTVWPGEKMQKDASGCYTFTVPADAAYIIFDAGTDLYQTVDIPFDGSVTEYQLTGKTDDDGKYLVETWSGGTVAAATKYDEVKQVSGADISIEKVRVEYDYYADSFSTNGGHDAVFFTVKNDTPYTVREITLYVVFYDENGDSIKPFLSYNMDNDISALETDGLSIAPGATKEVAYSCGAEDFDKYECIVAAYLVDRTLYENTEADAWVAEHSK